MRFRQFNIHIDSGDDEEIIARLSPSPYPRLALVKYPAPEHAAAPV